MKGDKMIAITGASGYLGSHLTRRLAQQGQSCKAFVRNRERAEKEERLKGLSVEWVEADVTNPANLLSALKDVDTVIHTVAIAIEKGDRTYEKINFQGTVNVVEAAKSNGVKRFINVSQLGADAGLPYRFLASKGKAQDFVASSGMQWTAFLPSVIWGPEDEFANTFARLVPLTPLIFPIVGDQNSQFQPIWVEDVVTACIASIDNPDTIGEKYELGGPEILTLEEIERRTLQAIGASRKMVHVPLSILKIAVTIMEKLLPNPPVTRSLLELLAVSNVTKHNAIQKFVFEPRPFTAENAAPYMRQFQVRETLSQFFGK
jgi:NADH dehydrogenase